MPAIGSTTAGSAASAGLYAAPIGNIVTVRSKEDSMRFRVAMFPVAVVATLGLTAAAAFGATIMVDSDGAATPTSCTAGAPGSAFLTIQGGVNAASPGDTVKVCGEPTPYARATVATHGVKLVGVNNPIIEGGAGNNGLTLNPDKLTVKGFEIRNSAAAILTNPN